MDGGEGPGQAGVIPNSFDHIFNAITASEDREFLIRASFLEIYNEEIRDLLSKNPKNKLDLKENADGLVYVKDLSNFVVNSVGDIRTVLEVGKKNRSVGATKMNQGSSRSHSVFTVTIESTVKDDKGNEHVRMGKLNLVDLAGSERAGKTEATGDRFKEGVKINMSLSALGNVISALVDGKSGHIPYRDSKLTRLLQDSLGGNTKTSMVANIGPADWNFDETMSTLRYADRAKNIKNKPRINEDPKDAKIREYQEEMKRLQEELARIDEMGGGDAPATPLSPQVIEEVEVRKRDVTEEEKEKIRRDIELELQRAASNQGSIKLSEEEMQRIHQEAEREAEQTKRRLEKERKRAEQEAQEKAQQLQAQQAETEEARHHREELAAAKKEMANKLQMMQNKLIHGGGKDELAKKAREKEEEIKRRMAELDRQRRKEREAAVKIKELEQKREQKGQKFNSLEEERDAKKKELEEVWATLQNEQREVADLEQAFADERSYLMEQVRELQSQLRLRESIIEAFIPADEQSKVLQKAIWNKEQGEWELGQISERAENATTLKRPSSASGTRRPMSSFALNQAAQGDQNPRFKSENILTLDLDMPERTTYVFTEETLADPNVREALHAVFVDGQVLF